MYNSGKLGDPLVEALVKSPYNNDDQQIGTLPPPPPTFYYLVNDFGDFIINEIGDLMIAPV
jgi:hypothetical protein